MSASLSWFHVLVSQIILTHLELEGLEELILFSGPSKLGRGLRQGQNSWGKGRESRPQKVRAGPYHHPLKHPQGLLRSRGGSRFGSRSHALHPAPVRRGRVGMVEEVVLCFSHLGNQSSLNGCGATESECKTIIFS